ncbi:MAG: acid phosphatase [Alphaproteobacteria bacterium]|nr:acid phosphatase [Alphaproteobacteria bacterium]
MRVMTWLLGAMLASGMAPLAWGQPTAPDPLAKIGHIVVIFEENRSFDTLFGDFPGANGRANAGDSALQVDADGKPYTTLPAVIDTSKKPPAIDPRFPAQLSNAPFNIGAFVPENQETGDLVHRFYQEQMQINGGAMNRFAGVSDAAGLAMGYYDMRGTHLWRLAREFTLGDAMFHSAFGGSFLNHTFLVCSCALRWPEAPSKIVAQVDANGRMVKDGQVTPDGYAVNTSQSVYLHNPKYTDESLLVPPQTMPHIGDRLDAKGIAWKWYSGGYDNAMAGHPDKLFQYHHQPLAYFKDLAPGTPAQRAHLQDYTDFVRDIEQNTLPPVVFYKPIGEFNLHPGYADVTDGDEHLGAIVAKLQASPAYADMMIIITSDENGGLWDHVAPPRRDKWGPGTRIPLIVVGPTVKRGYVDHTPYDFGSILRTIEVRFGVEPVAEPDANAYPMRNMLQ